MLSHFTLITTLKFYSYPYLIDERIGLERLRLFTQSNQLSRLMQAGVGPSLFDSRSQIHFLLGFCTSLKHRAAKKNISSPHDALPAHYAPPPPTPRVFPAAEREPVYPGIESRDPRVIFHLKNE